MIEMIGRVGTAAAASRVEKERAARRVERRAAAVRGVLGLGTEKRIPSQEEIDKAWAIVGAEICAVVGACVLMEVFC